MTTAHVEKFAELVGKDPVLLAKLGLDKVNADAAAAAASVAAFISNAVKEAKALGLEFTEDEARAFMAAEAKVAANGELSASQLDLVAGGKLKNLGEGMERAGNQTGNGVKRLLTKGQLGDEHGNTAKWDGDGNVGYAKEHGLK